MANENEQMPFYKWALSRPIEEITEDIFLRPDAFEDAPWYDDFILYTRIGVCRPDPKDIPAVQKALKMMGYSQTKTVERGGETYLVPGDKPPRQKYDRER